MKLSIILATANRPTIIKQVLSSIESLDLANQFSVELIVIDQSFNKETYDVVNKYEILDAIYIHALKKGLSHSRNIGLDICTGDFVCFADDDGTYDPMILNNLSKEIVQCQYDIYCGVVRCPTSKELTSYTRSNISHKVHIENFEKDVTSISLFIQRSYILEYNIRFDENLGLGAKFGSCEELDLVYQCLNLGCEIYYTPSLVTYHNEPNGYNKTKTYQYALGHGAFCSKRLQSYKFLDVAYVVKKIIKVIGKFPASLFIPNLHPYSNFKGFISGFYRYNKEIK